MSADGPRCLVSDPAHSAAEGRTQHPHNTADVGGRGAPGLDAAAGTEPGQTPCWRHRGDRTSPDSHELTFRKRLPHNTAHCTEINKDENDKKTQPLKVKKKNVQARS